MDPYFNPQDYAIYLIAMLIILAVYAFVAVLNYIIEAIALYKISKKRGYTNAWLSFVPVINSFVLGGIVDNINFYYTRKTNWRIWLLVFSLLGKVSLIPVATFMFSFFSGPATDTLLSILAIVPILGIASMVYFIIRFIALYKIYQDYNNKSSTLMMVFTVLFPFIIPFVLMSLVNRQSISLNMNTAQNRYRAPSNMAPYAGEQ